MRKAPHVVIMAVSTTLAYSLNGEYFAHSSADGTLKLWDTTTGTLKQAYTPSSHLSATCTCLAWGSLRISRVSFPLDLGSARYTFGFVFWLYSCRLLCTKSIHGALPYDSNLLNKLIPYLGPAGAGQDWSGN